MPVYVPNAAGAPTVVRLTWGFPLDGKPNAVLNACIKSVLNQLRCGCRGMWVKAIALGRYLVLARAFYEGHKLEYASSPVTSKPIRR